MGERVGKQSGRQSVVMEPRGGGVEARRGEARKVRIPAERIEMFKAKTLAPPSSLFATNRDARPLRDGCFCDLALALALALAPLLAATDACSRLPWRA